MYGFNQAQSESVLKENLQEALQALHRAKLAATVIRMNQLSNASTGFWSDIETSLEESFHKLERDTDITVRIIG